MHKLILIFFFVCPGLAHALTCQSALNSLTESKNLHDYYLDAFDVNDIKNISEKPQNTIVKTWQQEAYELYRAARIKNLELNENQLQYLLDLNPKVGELAVSHLEISLPSELATSTLAWILTAHELEHRIQFIELQRLGLDENYTNFFMAANRYQNEIDAMKAEWEFIRALSHIVLPELNEQITLLAQLYNPHITNLLTATELDLSQYISLNHSLGRYSLEATGSAIIGDLQAPKEKLSNISISDAVKNLVGEWEIKASVITEDINFYIDLMNFISPVPLQITLAQNSPESFLLRVEKAQ